MGSLGGEIARKKAMWLCPKVMGGANPSERWGHSACYFNGLVYIFGGCRGGMHFSDVLVCNLETMDWNILKTSGQGPGPRDSHSAVLVGHKMFVFGGTNGSKKVNDLHMLDLLSREWTRPQCYGILPSPRESHTANVVSDEKLVIFGGSGEGESNYLNDLHILDLKNMEWSTPAVRGNVPAPRDSHSSVAVSNRLFVFGGDSGDRYQGDVAVLDMNTFVWSRMNVHGHSPGPRAGHASVSIGTKVYVLGGVGDKKYYNDIWVLDMITTSWVQLDICSQKSQGRFSHTATITNLGIAIFGGCGEDERPLNELLILQIDSLTCRAFGNSYGEESKMFLKKTENNMKPIFLGENEDLKTKDVGELEFVSKESFQFSSDMLHTKRRRTSSETKPEPEEQSLPHSQHSSPSQSDHEHTPVQKHGNSYRSSRVHPLFRQRISSPSGCQMINASLNQTKSKHAISRSCHDMYLSSEHLNQRKRIHTDIIGTDDSCQVPSKAAESLPIEAGKFQNLIGAEVRGHVDGVFDSGYLMTATVNGKVFRGVLFAPAGPDLAPRDAIAVRNSPSLTPQINVNHTNVKKNHFNNNIGYPRHSQQLQGSGEHCFEQTQMRLLSSQIRAPLPISSRDSGLLNSELQGVVLTLAPGSDHGRP